MSGVGAPLIRLLETCLDGPFGCPDLFGPAIQLSKSPQRRWLVELRTLLYRVVTLHPTTPLAGESGPTRPGGGVAGTTRPDVAGIDTCHSSHRW